VPRQALSVEILTNVGNVVAVTGRGHNHGTVNSVPAWTPSACQAGGDCRRPPCFRLQLAGGRARGRSTLACGIHLGEVARDLAAWAQGRGLTTGQVTVLAIDPRRPTWPGGPVPGVPEPAPRGIVVGSFPLVNPGGLGPLTVYRP
jgi:hypothetical protein